MVGRPAKRIRSLAFGRRRRQDWAANRPAERLLTFQAQQQQGQATGSAVTATDGSASQQLSTTRCQSRNDRARDALDMVQQLERAASAHASGVQGSHTLPAALQQQQHAITYCRYSLRGGVLSRWPVFGIGGGGQAGTHMHPRVSGLCCCLVACSHQSNLVQHFS